ncbi:uncharacterized protein LOC119739773 [Patiria miniata]|uniref:Uncharacterized protein n=1 Tax=Patiria miniata TaxID=46514 RepID=A0A914B5L4_PATMI|nr:uncharacterized protein LOC119739773 [Patiria miniata]
MHWKQHSDGLCIVGLRGGVQPSYPARSASTSRASGRLTTLQNSQRLFVSPAPKRKSPAVGGALPDISQDAHRPVDYDMGVQGKAKVIHPSITSPRDVGTPILSCDGPSYRTKQNSLISERAESKSSQPAVHLSYPQHALRTRSPASNSVASLGDLSVTTVSLSSRTPSSRKTPNSEFGSSIRDGDSEFLSEILGEYVSPPPSPFTGAIEEPTPVPRSTPRRVPPPSTYHSKLLHMRSLLRDNGHPSDSVTTQTIELEKGNIQSFKKLLILTQIPKTNSKSPKSKPSSDSTAESESTGSSTSESTHRERNMLLGLHQLSRQNASRRNSSPGESRIDTDASILEPERPTVPSNTPTAEERPVKTLVDQWLGDCPVVGTRLETDSTKRRIEFSVPSIEEEEAET